MLFWYSFDFCVSLVSSSASCIEEWCAVLCCVAQYGVWEEKLKILTFINLLDVGEIYSRLLDHRPVIQGEIRYFVKEFEVSIFILLGAVIFRVWDFEQF